MKLNLLINNKALTVDVDDENTPLLWVLRDVLDMKGTKFGCGQAACGACTIHIDDQAVRSCVYPVSAAVGTSITTIEGLSQDGTLHPVQQAWVDEVVPQCGYCQPGFIMSTVALLKEIPNPTDKDIDDYIVNVCRCGTYYRMRKAIKRAVTLSLTQSQTENQNSDHGN